MEKSERDYANWRDTHPLVPRLLDLIVLIPQLVMFAKSREEQVRLDKLNFDMVLALGRPPLTQEKMLIEFEERFHRIRKEDVGNANEKFSPAYLTQTEVLNLAIAEIVKELPKAKAPTAKAEANAPDEIMDIITASLEATKPKLTFAEAMALGPRYRSGRGAPGASAPPA